MKELILIACYWIHLMATVIWVGGIIFILLIAIPSSKQVLGAEAGKLMGEISKRFTPLANYSIILLVVTGIFLAGLNKEFSGIRLIRVAAERGHICFTRLLRMRRVLLARTPIYER